MEIEFDANQHNSLWVFKPGKGGKYRQKQTEIISMGFAA